MLYDLALFEQIDALPMTFLTAAVQGVNFDAIIMASMATKGLINGT